MPTEIQTKDNNDTQSSKEHKSDIATMPMSDYNQHSHYQSKVNRQVNKLLTESAKHLIQTSPNAINIADFGCSHGKNSMECVKSALDGYIEAKDPVSVMVYLNDLPTNDFGEVFKCLNDPNISVYEHSLFKEGSGSTISVMVNGKSFNTQVFPTGQIHLSFSLNCLHWMEKPVKLMRGIQPKSNFSTPEEIDIISKDAHEQLVNFLRNRAIELKSGGRFICSIMKFFAILKASDELWKSYIESKGFTLDQFIPVTVPIYPRSIEEINSALNEVSDQFQALQSEPIILTKENFTIETFKAASFNVLLRGLKESQIFTNDTEAASFIDGYYQFTKDRASDLMEGELQAIVLERI